MKHQITIGIIILIALTSLVGMVTAQNIDTSQISVTNVQLDPTVLMHGDTGTVTLEVTNNGDNSVALGWATLFSNDITIVNANTYKTGVGDIGAGNTIEFTYTVRANAPDGIYYPKFYLDFEDSDSLRYFFPVKIDDTELQISVLERPDSFKAGAEEIITLLIGNPRENEINGITITPEGDCIDLTQTSYFVGSLKEDESAEVSFDVVPYCSTDLRFNVTYRNGINVHNTEIAIPVVVSGEKNQAELVLNNIELVPGEGHYLITGDVSNAGLEDAKSVLVTVGSPAVPVNPNPAYVVGALEPDDFSSFEVSFNARDLSSVPIVIQYKDEDGDSFEEIIAMDLSSTSDGMNPQTDLQGKRPSGNRGILGSLGSGISMIPWTNIAIGIIVLIIIGALYVWKKDAIAKARKKK